MQTTTLFRSYGLLTLALSFTMSFAAHDYPVSGTGARALGGCNVMLTDHWAVFNNQAALAFLKTSSVGFYGEHRFLLKELGVKAMGFVLPTPSGVFGLGHQYFGYAHYNETKTGIAFGKKLAEATAAGIQVDYLTTYIAGQPNRNGLVTFELGLLSKVNERVTLGVHLFNPTDGKLSRDTEERIRSVFRMGIQYDLSDDVFTTAEVEKRTDYPPVLKTGVAYQLTERIIICTGISTNPVTNVFGFGLRWDHLEVHFASAIHPVLGYTPQVAVVYVPG